MKKQSVKARSEQLFQEALHYMPGGVNSPVRAFKAVGGFPRFIQSAKGAYLTDADDQRYIDYVGSWGPMILGHAHPCVVSAVQKAAEAGLSYGAPCELEIKLAQKICNWVPSIEKVRMVSSGTEAAMTAIRLARAVTGKAKIIKFEGCYHGHSDALLVKAGSGSLTFSVPSSAGVLATLTHDTLIARFNDIQSVITFFEKYSKDIAAVIVEPIPANMNLILPKPGFLQALREITQQYQSLLIFDEVITGFRVGLGGAQEYFKVMPDITILGKIIGGGMPVGAIGARAEIMDYLSPLGSVYQAGTLSGNPVAMAAGLATLSLLETPNFYTQLAKRTQELVLGLITNATTHQVPLLINSIGSLFGLFFTTKEVITSYEDALDNNQIQFKQFFHAMLKEYIYFAPSAFEVGFVSSAHEEKEIKQTLVASEKVFSRWI